MDKKTYSKEEFQAMVASLESEFMNLMKSEQEAQQLAKSEDEKDEAKEDKKEDNADSKAPEAKDEKPEENEGDESAKEEQKEESKEEDESHGYDEEDLEEMHKMYGSMSKGELKAHKESIEKCWMGKCGEMTEMGKSEEKSVETTQEPKVEDLLKSELEAIKKENEDLKKNVEGLVSAINDYVTKKPAPARKAITDIEFVKKSEEEVKEKPLTKSEISNILAKKAQDPKLSPQDRAAINSFYLTNAGVEKIAHLLKQ